MKQNITVALDKRLLKAARAFAAKRGTSVSAMLSEDLSARMETQRRYEKSRRLALELLERPWSLGGVGLRDRASLHERAALR